jgi:zinc protease
VAVAPPRPLPPALAGEIETRRLANGLELCLVASRQAPIVSSAIFYRAGSRDEPAGGAGLAHFLEHMMFKGSARYGPGEIDRLTQTLGGTNNAFTGHDVTAYYFAFAADRWAAALDVEADRMRGLRLDPDEVASERQVILEEIAMYRDDPWDALEIETLAALYDGHPYGRPVLGTEGDLATVGGEELARFHRRFYRPDNAVLVVAGDFGADARERVEAAFGAVAPGPAEGRPPLAPPRPGAGLARVERQQGEVARLLVALPAPPPDDPDHAGLRLLAAALGLGRSSRLQRTLVEEGELCLAVSVGLAESVLASAFTIGAELLPGADAGTVERLVAEALAELAARPLAEEELERARQVFLADWVFGQERIHQQGLAAGLAISQFDLGQPERLLRRALEADAGELVRLAARWLDLDRGGVVGRSLPA